jgi:hypothetical protein
MYDLDTIDLSIIDDRFQAIVKEKGEENIKIELLRRIVNDELRVKMSSNIRKMTNLKKELEKVLGNYHKNSLDSIAAIKHILDIANELKSEDLRIKELGLNPDELAFYDLLEANSDLVNAKGPIQDLVHKVVASVKKNLQLDHKWLIFALAFFGSAIVIWTLSDSGKALCYPDSLLQGHSAWHLLSACMTICIHFYFLSEKPEVKTL